MTLTDLDYCRLL